MRRLSLVTLLITGCLLLGPGAARADDPQFVGWTELLPGLTMEFMPSSENDCTAGRTRCVDAVIREMSRRFDPLASSCDHDSIFALAYLRTTEEYRRTIEDPTFFEDTAFVNHEDVVFARLYFDAFDAWHAGRYDAVPPAWDIAFDAADDRSVPASGNLMLGINAHVQRDLPFTLAGIGLVKPDGSSRKPDHDRVNRFLNRINDDLYAEIARRFDPTIEIAWRNAERLVTADSPTARAHVAASIEAYAASQAEAIRRASAYGLLRNSAARDAYCSTHHG
jgi:Family of unknown function (DUF5995)